MTSEDLARRCEAATGPDRALDCAIRDTLRLPNDYGADWGARGHEIPAAHPYTASLDAALTLVPEGYFPTIDFANSRCWIRDRQGFDVLHGPAYGFAATPALALCAAALRAGATPC